jgi:hypothetical protein
LEAIWSGGGEVVDGLDASDGWHGVGACSAGAEDVTS